MSAVGPSPAPKPVPVASLREFFRGSVDAAIATNQVALEDHTVHYVVNLLTFFARSEAFFESTPAGPRLQPLAFMLAEAAEADTTEERNVALRRLGDVALFIAGFFADGLQRSPVGVDYYVRMGGGAYHSLAQGLPANTRGRAFAPVFTELAIKFQDMVDVLTDVRHAAGSASDRDILRLYELWLTTGSRRAARLLHRLGVLTFRQPGSTRPH